ncbi:MULTISPECIES: NAD-dependent epimerase/dehydratase family protein [unclassified Lentimicrobium]|uniref:NAD-dependent epimerase/dehydratase family protein n=1 Tax=unclassified Lentimicrobium TaxID=2677434 RepID=UPI001551F253|nr:MULTISPECIES: NAD-dependent epimerase/dehydratase family protein [unclassified Lentimicrobium]NPD47083.1 NAD-dependent epimerase/dehydratase family protein [Lentimicrobium sp. S6]NPD85731.1 NAD-dependent epimerase/dehydratase family protein [Lentimicrobium sp. L6]
MENILVIGAAGQIGSELVIALRKKFGSENVFATDIKEPPTDVLEGGPFQIMDVMDSNRLIHFVIRHKITQIYHLAAVLSGNAEKIPLQAWDINMRSLMNILELAKEVPEVKRVFWPSSIAIFGPSTPRQNTPQYTITEPNTVYGISKLAGERWVEYYHQKYGLDIRSIRYPGLISYKTEAGGGTTDYAVEIFYEAIREGKYESFLSEDTSLPMMFMDDAIQATIDLMDADIEDLSIHSSYNVAGMSFNPKQLAEEIKEHIPEFKISYKPDFRQAIADSWPACIDDSVAKKDWGLNYKYDIKCLTKVMLDGIKEKLS